jgi:predicted ribosome quality control (RQC) complex YloA/Tae2 family protein
MATAQGMSGLDLRSALTEWNRLLPLWVYKVYQISPKVVVIRLHGKEHARHQLLVEAGRRAHLTDHPFSPPKNPPSFAMLLRKHLTGGKVLRFTQTGIQRIFTMDVGRGESTLHLVVELFDNGNIILCGDDLSILQPLSFHRFKERDIVPGVVYQYPPPDPTTLDPDGFSKFLKSDSRDIVRALAVGSMLGGTLAEHLCRATGTDKTIPAGEADAQSLYRALQGLLSRAESGISPVVSGKECIPFPLDEETPGTSTFASFNQALDGFYPSTAASEPARATRKERVPQADRIRAQQTAAVKKFTERIARSERAAEEIYAHYPQVQEILDSLGRASRTHSWQEIGEILKAQKSGPAKKILAVHPEEGSVDVDLGERVTLYVLENVEANAGRYYEQAKKYRKKIQGAHAAMERVIPRKERKTAQVPPMKKKWFHRFRWFYTTDGVLVVGGRDASQNEELVKKYMEGGDMFVHADVHGASVVIVKGRTERMDEAAIFAASYSGAWKSGHFSADVYAVSPGQVSKTPEAGEYVSRGSFIIRGERTYYRNVPLGVAIGLQLQPEVGVIGGPTEAVRTRTSLLVELRPGTYEPNDTAKKVLRILRERLPPADQQAKKGVLNTESVAGFVPPGGSDILEEA